MVIGRDDGRAPGGEVELREYERLLRTVANNATLALFIMDERQQCVYMNPAAEQLTGYSLAETQGRALHDIVHHTRPDGTPYPLAECPIDRALPQNNQEQGTEVFVHRDGTFYPVAFTASPIRDEATGRPVGTIIEVRDIREELAATAERERLLAAERRSRERAQRLHAATAALSGATTPDAVARVIVSEGIAVAGAAAAVVYVLAGGGERLEPIAAEAGHPGAVEGWPATSTTAEAGAAEAVRTGTPIWLADREAHAGRYPRLVDAPTTGPFGAWCMLPMFVEGRATGSLAFAFRSARTFEAEDRALLETFAAQAAQALERARLYAAEHRARLAAEAANRAKSEFLAVMSHELRTPLNAIGGYADLLEMGLYGPLAATQQEALARIRRSQRHLLGLINDLLNYARVESGAVRYDVRPLLVADVVSGTMPFVEPQLEARDIAFAVHLPELAGRAPIRVRADPEKLQQILLNLLSNAVKFTAPGGRVTVELLEPPQDARVVALRVSDTGAGIPADKLEAIFEPFVQVDASLTRSHDGVGLGLAISRDLARGMGGDLTAESELGVGSTFTLTLPVA